MEKALVEKIEDIIQRDKIVLFMKWDKQRPMCWFSANAVHILKDVWAEFSTYNILEDQEVREWLKEYSQWPTYPQLYVNSQLIWGSDIITELYEEGNLKKELWIA